MEIYKNGNLDVFRSLTGKIQQTSQDITIGQELLNQTSYTLFGSVDEVRIYDSELSMDQIKTLPTLWNTSSEINTADIGQLSVYPNPSDGIVMIEMPQNEALVKIEVFDLTGKNLPFISNTLTSNTVSIELFHPYHGLVIMKIQSTNRLHFFKVLFL